MHAYRTHDLYVYEPSMLSTENDHAVNTICHHWRMNFYHFALTFISTCVHAAMHCMRDFCCG